MNFIKVKVKYLSPYFRNLVGVDEEEVVLKSGSKLIDVLKEVSKAHGGQVLTQIIDEEKKEFRGGVLIAVNDAVVSNVNIEVKDGDVVTVLIALDAG